MSDSNIIKFPKKKPRFTKTAITEPLDTKKLTQSTSYKIGYSFTMLLFVGMLIMAVKWSLN